MSDCCCCPPGGSTGGGVAAGLAMVALGVFVWLNITAIITFLLLVVAGIVTLTVASVGGALFLRRFIVPRWSSGSLRVRGHVVSYELGPAAADIMAQTALRRPQPLELEAGVVEDGVYLKSLEEGPQRRAEVIHAAAREAAINGHASLPRLTERAPYDGYEPRPLRDWFRRSLDPAHQDRGQ